MRRRALVLTTWLGLSLLAANAAAIDSEPAFDDPVMQARYEALNRELRCLVCQNQSIADSNATLAQDLRREVREMMGQGSSDDQIRQFMTARYGDFVLYDPPLAPRTWLLWAAPGLLVLFGVLVAILVIRRRARSLEADPLTDDGLRDS